MSVEVMALEYHNLYAQHGPHCPTCSGLGRVLRPSAFTKVRYTSKCETCRGTGVDHHALMQAERLSIYQRLDDMAATIARLEGLQSKTGKNGVMSRQTWTELIAWATADGTAIANSVTETIIMPNITIPANYMQDGRSLSLKSYGRLSTTATPTIRFRLRWGGVAGTVIWDSGTITLTTVTAAIWGVPEIIIQTRSNGATGTLFAIGQCVIGAALAPSVASATGAAAIGVFGSAGDDTPAAVTCDLTADTALSLTALWSAQSASNTATGHVHELESKN